MLARELSSTIPRGLRQSLDDDARGVAATQAFMLTPSPRVLICDALEAYAMPRPMKIELSKFQL